MTEITGNLKAAMEEYGSVIDDSDNDPEVVAAMKTYNDKFEEMEKAQQMVYMLQKPHNDKINELAEYIKAQVMEHGSSVSHAGVDAKHRKGYERVTWNNKEMTSLCMKNPALLDLLASARKVSEVDPSVKISYTLPEPVKEPEER